MAASSEIVFIVGPTGTGKSDLTASAARERGAIIVNADSVQLYKDVNVGSAKPDAVTRELCPHFLFDVIERGQECTAGDYRRMALEIIERHFAEKPVFVVGGSGFYLRALEFGMFDVPEVPETVRQAVEADWQLKGNAGLWQELASRDPETAERIHINDTYRLKRAVSLLRVQEKSLSQTRAEFAQQNKPLGQIYPLRKLGLTLPRERLRDRLTRRAERMIAAGLIDEVKSLLAAGLRDWAPLKSVGYAETVKYLDGELAAADLVPAIVQSTMALAKRQMTWFKRDTSIRWFDSEKELEQARRFLLEP